MSGISTVYDHYNGYITCISEILEPICKIKTYFTKIMIKKEKVQHNNNITL